MTQEDKDTCKFFGAIGIYAIVISSIIAVASYSGEMKEAKKNKVVMQPKPQTKDTSSYHWSDEYTNVQLREMCKDGTLKLK